MDSTYREKTKMRRENKSVSKRAFQMARFENALVAMGISIVVLNVRRINDHSLRIVSVMLAIVVVSVMGMTAIITVIRGGMIISVVMIIVLIPRVA
jgi:hypothetical protein